MKKLSIALLGFWILLGCNSKSPISSSLPKTETVQKQEAAAPPMATTLSYRLVAEDTVIYRQISKFKTEQDSLDYQRTDIAKIRFSFPQIEAIPSGNLAVKDSINHWIQNRLLSQNTPRPAASVEELLRAFVAEYIDYEQEMKEFGLPVGPKWFYELRIDIAFSSADWLSLKVVENEFRGGAHANNTTQWLTIDLKTGQPINLVDLWVTTTQKQRDSLLHSHLIAAIKEQKDSSKFVFPTHFLLQNKGIAFYYNAYELDVARSVDFEISYDELYPLLHHQVLPLDRIQNSGGE